MRGIVYSIIRFMSGYENKADKSKIRTREGYFVKQEDI